MADTAQTLGQNTSTSQTQTSGTDINLNLNFDDIKIPEAPTTTPNLNIDFSDIPKPEVETQNIAPVEASPVEEVNPVTETPANETMIESHETLTATPETPKDDRLAQEDKIVEKTETPVVEEGVVTPEPTPEVMAANLPTTSLKEDQKIIEELMSTTNATETSTPVIEAVPAVETQNVASVETVTTPIVENHEPLTATPEPKNSGMDLDALLGTPNTTPIANEVIIAPVINQTPIITTPTIITTTPSITGSTFQATIPNHHKSGNIKTFAIFAILAGASAYVLATMYPLEYQNMKANVMGIFGGESTISESTDSLESMLESTGTIANTGGLLTGIIQTTGEITTGAIQTGDLSTPGFDGFADLQNILTGANNGSPVLTDQQLTQLKKYADEAKTFVELGKKISDKVMLKYGTYVSKKADGLILSIENKEQIDNAKIDGYLAQFSGYLHQLTTLSYDDLTNPTDPEENKVISQETNTSASGTNDTTQNMIQDINRDNSGTTTPPISETPTLPSGTTQVPPIPGF